MKGSKDSLLCKCLPWPRDGTQVSSIAGRLYHLSHQGIPKQDIKVHWKAEEKKEEKLWPI